MKIGWKNALTILFLIIGVSALYFIFKQYDIKGIISFYSHFDLRILLLYALVVFILYVTLTWRWDVILQTRGKFIPFHKLFIYRIIGTAVNFFTPGPRVGGEPTQANLLTKHDVEFTEGLSTVMIDKIIDTTTCGILFIIGAILVGLKYSLPKNTEIIMIITGTIFIVLISIFYYRMLNSRHFMLNLFRFLRLDRTKIGWLKKAEARIEKIEVIMIEFYKHNKKSFMISIGITILTWVEMFFEYKFATMMLGMNVGMVELFFIITFIGLAQLFPIPMAVGVLEAGQLSAFSLMKLPAGAGIALAFIVRIKDLIIGIIGLILLAAFGFHVGKTMERGYKEDKYKV
jgi:glycosyltransferase 2 family protein